jgi:hypothetical protein
MQNNVNRIICLIIVSLSISSLTACSSLTNMTELFKSGKDNNNAQQDFIVTRQITSPKLISEREAQEQQAQIRTLLAQWEEMQPNLTKVIAMSEDMAYVMDTLNSQSVTDSIGIDEFSVSQTPAEIAEIVKQNKQADVIDNTNIQLQSAKPILASKFATNNINTEDLQLSNKFQSSEVANNTSGSSSAIANKDKELDISDKFMTSKPRKIAQGASSSASSPCLPSEITAIADGSMFAIHLASYNEKTNLSGGLSVFKEKFKSSLCGLTAVYKPVEVKGNNYFSLRAGPFESEVAAKKICQNISATGQYCGVTRFEGMRL